MTKPQVTRNSGGPKRIQTKAALIAGCNFRKCKVCGKSVFVPSFSEWTTCMVCRRAVNAR